MQRSIIILYGAMLALAITLLLFVFTRPEAPLDEAGVRSIVSEMIEERGEQSSNSNIDKEQLNISIEQYLLSNPRILESMSSALQAENRQLEVERTGVALLAMKDLIYNDEDNIVLGNPDGDVALVEFFDYNCPFCKQVMPHIPELLDNDPNLKIIIKEFPILGQDSVDVARLSIAIERLGHDYWAFHKALFTGRERVTIEKARKVSLEMNINFIELELEAKKPEIDEIIKKSYTIAEALSINGTPAFIIGEEILPGAVDVEELRYRIENMRECGKANC
ncbi:MAG: DsbA family protein [Devosiaceae bacterium]|nr:DsbA family protein [Devosiaceae bacterium]